MKDWLRNLHARVAEPGAAFSRTERLLLLEIAEAADALVTAYENGDPASGAEAGKKLRAALDSGPRVVEQP